MKTTKEKICDLLAIRDYSVTKLALKLRLSNQIIHRHFKSLLAEDCIGKKGTPPKVWYFAKKTAESQIAQSADFCAKKFLPLFDKQNNDFWKLTKKQKVDFDFLLTTSALYSSNIEGNTLDLNSFLNRKVLSQKKKKEAQEIDDLKRAYLYASKHCLLEDNFLQTHKILSKRLVSASRQGRYRQEKVGVFDGGGLVYLAVEAEFVNSEMSLLFAQISILLMRKMTKQEARFWSLWVHLMFVLIHPFADGNGRAARLLEKWFVVSKLGKDYWYLESEKYYWQNLQPYYKNLKLGANYWEIDFAKAKGLFVR